ncbi:hypothetical protein RB653_006232 [Dictyostelium firmibasis]|uniref:Uncharacterized protein n=1 Tax=Dictyostelium firmibasis TaxID=79012 RepID=A0AAN7U8L3_9MYCE
MNIEELETFRDYQLLCLLNIGSYVLKDTYKKRNKTQFTNKSYLKQLEVLQSENINKNGIWHISSTSELLLSPLNNNKSKITLSPQQIKENKAIEIIKLIDKNNKIDKFENLKIRLIENIEILNESNKGYFTKERVEEIINNNGNNKNFDENDQFTKKLIKESNELFKNRKFKESLEYYNSKLILCKNKDSGSSSSNNSEKINVKGYCEDEDESKLFKIKSYGYLGSSMCDYEIYRELTESKNSINEIVTLEYKDLISLDKLKYSLSYDPFNSESHYQMAFLLCKNSNAYYNLALNHLEISILLNPINEKYKKLQSMILEKLLIKKANINNNNNNNKDDDKESIENFELAAIEYVKNNPIPLEFQSYNNDIEQLYQLSLKFSDYNNINNDNDRNNDKLYDYKLSMDLLYQGSLLKPLESYNEVEKKKFYTTLSNILLEIGFRYFNGCGYLDADNVCSLYYFGLVTKQFTLFNSNCFHLTTLAFMFSFPNRNVPKPILDSIILPMLLKGSSIGNLKCQKLYCLLTGKDLNKTFKNIGSSESIEEIQRKRMNEKIQNDDQYDFVTKQYEYNSIKRSNKGSKKQIDRLIKTFDLKSQFLDLIDSGNNSTDEKLIQANKYLIDALKLEYHSIRIPSIKENLIINRLIKFIDDHSSIKKLNNVGAIVVDQEDIKNARLVLLSLTIRKPIPNFKEFINDSINQFPNEIEFIFYRAMNFRLNNDPKSAQLDFNSIIELCGGGGSSSDDNNFPLKYLYYQGVNRFYCGSISESDCNDIIKIFKSYIDKSFKEELTYKVPELSYFISLIYIMNNDLEQSKEWFKKSINFEKSQLPCFIDQDYEIKKMVESKLVPVDSKKK